MECRPLYSSSWPSNLYNGDHAIEERGKIELFWVMFTNPAVSLPNRNKMIDIMKKVFLVVQDPFLSETAELADLVLPTALWGEKEGTMTNLERRVNVLRKAVPPYHLPSDLKYC